MQFLNILIEAEYQICDQNHLIESNLVATGLGVASFYSTDSI